MAGTARLEEEMMQVRKRKEEGEASTADAAKQPSFPRNSTPAA